MRKVKLGRKPWKRKGWKPRGHTAEDFKESTPRPPLKRGKKLRPRSKKREAYMVGRRERVAEAVGDGHNPCQMRAPGCTGSVQGIHEVLPRGRAGGLEAAERDGEVIDCCHHCNGYASENPIEALANGWLRKARPMEEA